MPISIAIILFLIFTCSWYARCHVSKADGGHRHKTEVECIKETPVLHIGKFVQNNLLSLTIIWQIINNRTYMYEDINVADMTSANFAYHDTWYLPW